MQPAADGDPGHPGAGTATAACGSCRRLSTAQDGALLTSPPAFMSCSLRPGHSWGLDMLRPALGSNGKQRWKARAGGMEQPAAGTPPFNPIIPPVLGAQHQHMLPCRASRPEFTPSSWGAQGHSSNNCSPALHKVPNSSKVFTPSPTEGEVGLGQHPEPRGSGWERCCCSHKDSGSPSQLSSESPDIWIESRRPAALTRCFNIC